MKSVVNNTYELIIKKSKFLTFTYRVNNIKEINIILNELSNKYSDATHICYAYILDNISKCSDDGEPAKTAGMPILNVLQKEKLNNVLTVIVRYFGGIKLGASGLIRAYSTACKNSLIIAELTKGFKIKLIFDYNIIKQVDYILKESIIENKIFDAKTTYIVLTKEENIESLKKICVVEKLEEIYF